MSRHETGSGGAEGSAAPVKGSPGAIPATPALSPAWWCHTESSCPARAYAACAPAAFRAVGVDDREGARNHSTRHRKVIVPSPHTVLFITDSHCHGSTLRPVPVRAAPWRRKAPDAVIQTAERRLFEMACAERGGLPDRRHLQARGGVLEEGSAMERQRRGRPVFFAGRSFPRWCRARPSTATVPKRRPCTPVFKCSCRAGAGGWCGRLVVAFS